MSSSGRQLRSSGQAPNISVDSLATGNVSPDEQHNEINRIVDCPLDEVLSNYRVGTRAEMIQIYKMLSTLVHPDKQTDDIWKKRATEAQQKLNEARERFTTPDDIPEPEKIEPPKANHKQIWAVERFVASVRRLHIEPDRADVIAILDMTNKMIDGINTIYGFPQGCGHFPLQYLRYNYRSAQAMLKSYNESDDAEYKAHATVLFRSFSETTQEFCAERGLPLEWAWDIKEINQLPVYLSEYQAADNELLATIASNNDLQPTDSMDTSYVAGQPITQPANVPENTQQPSGSIAQPAIISGNTQPGSDSSPPPAVSQSGAPQPTPMYSTSPSGQPPAYKRKIGKHYLQYLVREDSGLRVWKSETSCVGMDLTKAEFIIKPTNEFVAQHKQLYGKVTWIAMQVDGAITHGAGPHPPVTMNVQWGGGLEDTPLWRTDLIGIVGKDQVARDILQHLPYHDWIEFEGQKVFVESPTTSGLMKGRGKAIQRILDQRGKAAKASDLATSALSLASSVPQPTTSQPAAPHQETAAVPQSTVPQPPAATVPQPAVPQPTAAQPMPAQPTASQAVDLTNPQMAMLFQQFRQMMLTQPSTA